MPDGGRGVVPGLSPYEPAHFIAVLILKTWITFWLHGIKVLSKNSIEFYYKFYNKIYKYEIITNLYIFNYRKFIGR